MKRRNTMKRRGQFCDGAQRRDFLRVGSGSLFGAAVSLSGMLSGESHAAADAGGVTKDDRSLIIVFLKGGLSTIDTFDMKPAAPREVRGPFQPMSTRVPGLTICELMPRMAQAMHKVALVRTIVGFKDRHESFQCYTGRPGGRPGDEDLQDSVPPSEGPRRSFASARLTPQRSFSEMTGFSTGQSIASWGSSQAMVISSAGSHDPLTL